ncbi:MAG: 50S ribosomal protein L17 [Candidatus Levybacteria bacterium]|nr:50S ribosomal protein L17 [Candidatus Levybacteria bacterium]
MRKNVFGRQFSRDANERKSLFKSLISALILQGSIRTTLEKAKAIKGDVDKIVNKAKKGDITLKIQLLRPHIGVEAIDKVIKEIAPRFKDRSSGYTTIIKLGRRFSDNAAMVSMEWVIKPEIKNEIKELPAGKAEKPKTKRKATKK